MVLKVYLDPCTVNSRKVLAGLKLMGVDYEYNHIDYFKGEQKSEEYLKINPCATVPGAVDGDLCIMESNAIMAYAADFKGSPAYPKDLKIRARVNSWLLWESSRWFQSCYIYLVDNVVKPLLNAEPDQAVIDKEAPNFHKLASVLEAQLLKTKFLACDEVTIADIAIAAPMHLHEAQKLPLEKYPKLSAWLAEIEKLPAWKETQGAVEKALLPHKTANGTSSAATNGSANGAGQGQVKATFNYTKDLSDKLTELYFYDDPKAATIHEPGDDPHEMTVYGAWKQNDETPFDVDVNGFSIHKFHSECSEWENEEAVKKTLYPEVVEFLKKQTGAKRVLVFDHTIRTKANVGKKLTQETNTTQRAPVMLVHCDYTAESGPVRVKQLLGDEADELLSKRVAFINVWKPVRGVVKERPLAMCDIKSAPKEDFFKLYLRYRERTGENYVMRHQDAHKWWYFPEITPEQVILLKTYDSEGPARFVGHSAFEDPTTPADAPARESVEIRTICFF